MFASECTSDDGIIAIDDIFHPDWPGVTEGIYNVLSQHISPFVPFFITRKKLFCCSASLQKRYKNIVHEQEIVEKRDVEFCGWKIPSLNFSSEY